MTYQLGDLNRHMCMLVYGEHSGLREMKQSYFKTIPYTEINVNCILNAYTVCVCGKEAANVRSYLS